LRAVHRAGHYVSRAPDTLELEVVVVAGGPDHQDALQHRLMVLNVRHAVDRRLLLGARRSRA
jgi:hypothetical protein